MWVVTTSGFFSAVQHRDNPKDVLVRARNEADILNLKEIIPTGEIIGPLERADYRWRLRCSRAEWMGALAVLAGDIDYANFKDAVKAKQGAERASILMGVWSRLLALSDRPARTWTGGTATTLFEDDFADEPLGKRMPDCVECGDVMYEWDRGVCYGCGAEVKTKTKKGKRGKRGKR